MEKYKSKLKEMDMYDSDGYVNEIEDEMEVETDSVLMVDPYVDIDIEIEDDDYDYEDDYMNYEDYDDMYPYEEKFRKPNRKRRVKESSSKRRNKNQVEVYQRKYFLEEENDDATVKKVIKDVIDTDWSKDNESQMKVVNLLKGIATSDNPMSNKFMKKIDDFTSGLDVKEFEERFRIMNRRRVKEEIIEPESQAKKLVKMLRDEDFANASQRSKFIDIITSLFNVDDKEARYVIKRLGQACTQIGKEVLGESVKNPMTTIDNTFLNIGYKVNKDYRVEVDQSTHPNYEIYIHMNKFISDKDELKIFNLLSKVGFDISIEPSNKYSLFKIYL